ncbi:hypothetical protein J5N97_022589 [Dioscorea zingiberensis]|uniref:Exoribonuclease phosphorolytic domain-containing protein n=1 Tax=Dioscorea zingiberensis TaxID=325984 RepID=A0A9D5CAS3_9LILI|nr:hypothetical protein J5N97_022589 [Dioscorea zingiberensis]
MVDTLAEKALLVVLPPEDEFPYTVCVNSEVMSFDGSTPMASVCGGSMALMDASIPLREHVAVLLLVQALHHQLETVVQHQHREQVRYLDTKQSEELEELEEEPVLEDRLPDLLAQLRPYQLHAAYWMLQTRTMDCCIQLAEVLAMLLLRAVSKFCQALIKVVLIFVITRNVKDLDKLRVSLYGKDDELLLDRVFNFVSDELSFKNFDKEF